ncbi:MAG: ATP/GTP-binding protein [Campylobacterales bacterium]|nr:ATP/GTP-binding protein [Campylobacterales bacterium]
MQIQNAQAAYNNLSFSIKTSSGDTLSLSMYDNKEMSYQSYAKDGLFVEEFSLSHAYGYKFSYEGNGIDVKDQEEIAKALEALQPRIDAYIQNVQDSGIPSPRAILNEAFSMRQELPTPKDENTKGMLQDGLLKAFDQGLAKFSPQEKVLETTQKLFEKLLEQLESFSLYA